MNKWLQRHYQKDAKTYYGRYIYIKLYGNLCTSSTRNITNIVALRTVYFLNFTSGFHTRRRIWHVANSTLTQVLCGRRWFKISSCQISTRVNYRIIFILFGFQLFWSKNFNLRLIVNKIPWISPLFSKELLGNIIKQLF